ncbi:MAG: phospholipase D-like domain-containing protein [Spirochaetaceae bacterium]|jgi:cardiolipin synthase|nr:phospholipase D-like domain-containing protein [Spirochaetaceae bacterium]
MEGSSVLLLKRAFLLDWSNCRGEKFERSNMDVSLKKEEQIPMQIVLSGPDFSWSTLKLSYFNLITNANREVLIQSPYFVPDQSMMDALIMAALSGIPVELMITGIADKHIPWWAAHTYFPPLLRAGVKIYLYQKGFLHAKVLVIDSMTSSVGSCNMDIRSFSLNYEINGLIYHEKTAKKLKEQFQRDKKHCKELTMEEYNRLGILRKFRNSFMRIFAPLL